MTQAHPSIFLFDIDGTLISTAGAGRRAFERAFADLAGPGDHLEFSFAGMTDRSIARQGLVAAQLEATDEAIEAAIEAYLGFLPEFVDAADGYTIFSGVVELLDALGERTNAAIGLGTGNIERGARIKLARGGLNPHFDFGGFGCDAEDRAELIAAGARRGAERLGMALERCRVIVIGDTDRDIAAARAIGAECLGVATGGATVDELLSYGAHHGVEALTDPSAREFLWG
ncbi:HAD family hydrolase [Persicimonas caeni]|uniref:HAD family hydrolase n=1 Tax=Persicimonas caeni TaxID=2292766 RepID=A0A4Y6PZN5_PERCE|nr:HAD family hydrolase [Persicimonas caeni]QDG53786.1 HAD family hydrolase [Persicimonas caeni]QED35007.1 HAD family hydrolase [Persicimonas caeni]